MMHTRMGGCRPRIFRWHSQDEESMGGPFGVKRPLRYLAWKLDLDEKQIAELAKILDELKTERAQAAVDDRRTLTDFAEALSGEVFGEAQAKSASRRRAQSAERLAGMVQEALSKIHALLKPEQREKLAYLVRTGSLMI